MGPPRQRAGIEPDHPFPTHVANNRATGRDGNDAEQYYISSVALEEYWEIERIEECLQPVHQHIVDAESVKTSYLRVLSTLVMIDCIEYIGHFTHNGIDDNRLPLQEQPPPLATLSVSAHWWDSFYNAQWQFCPVEFGLQRRLARRCLDLRQIWPITSIEDMTGGQGEVVRSSKVTVDPDCIQLLGNENICVFKQYTGKGYLSYKNETDAYTNLSRYLCPSIIHCYEWFEQGGKYTIILEFAEHGSLIDYWKGHEPTQQRDIDTLWTNFFELLQGLAVIHSNLPRTRGPNGLKLFGMHLDIKPGNILVFKKPGSSNIYDVQFKIADFGLSRTRPIITGQPDPIDRDPGGSRMYCPPETTRRFDWTDSLPIQVGRPFDVWGMGCVFSEMVSWVVGGQPERERYRQLREEQMPAAMKDAGYSACFHNGEGPLPLVKDYHYPILLNTYRIGDSKSFQVGQMVVRDMLLKEPASRLTAQQLYARAKNLEEEYPFLEVTPILKVSMSDLQTSAHQPSFRHSNGSSHDTGEQFDFSPQRPASGADGGSPLTPPSGHFYYQGHPTYGNPTLTYRPFSQTAPEFSPTTLQSQGSNSASPSSGPTQPQVQATPTRMPQRQLSQKLIGDGTIQRQTSGFSHTPIPGPPSLMPRTTIPNGTISDQHPPEVAMGTSNMNYQAMHGNTPISQLESEQVTGNGTTHSVHGNPRAIGLKRQETETQDTVDYTTILKWKAEKRKVFSSMFGSSKTNSMDIPWLRQLESAKKTLGKRELIFVIDDSFAMREHWQWVVNLFKALYFLVKPLDDDGVDVYFTSDPNKSFKEKAWETTENYIKRIEDRAFSSGPCPMENCLAERFRKISQDIDRAGTSARRTSLFVLSNGHWAPNNEDRACGIGILIRDLVRKLVASGMNRFQVSLQFVRFNEDNIGTPRLAYLDDVIQKEHNLAFDIVDQKHFTSDVCSILLGPLDRANDDPQEISPFNS